MFTLWDTMNQVQTLLNESSDANQLTNGTIKKKKASVLRISKLNTSGETILENITQRISTFVHKKED